MFTNVQRTVRKCIGMFIKDCRTVCTIFSAKFQIAGIFQNCLGNRKILFSRNERCLHKTSSPSSMVSKLLIIKNVKSPFLIRRRYGKDDLQIPHHLRHQIGPNRPRKKIRFHVEQKVPATDFRFNNS